MLRGIVLGLMTAAAVAFGAGLSSPAEARVYISFNNGYHHGHYIPFFHHCAWRNVYVKVWNKKKHKWMRRWVTKRVCW